MGLFDRFKKKKVEDDDELPETTKESATELYNKRLKETKEKVYWNTGICWKCGQTIDQTTEYCWECGTKYKVKK